MIDWKLTKEKFNRQDIKGDRPKVIVRCDKCGKTKERTIRIKKNVINSQMAWECVKCITNKPEVIANRAKARPPKKPGTAYKRWFNKNKESILSKNRERRRLKQKTCVDCNKTLPIDKFYKNNTYITKHCIPCENAYKLKRNREISLYHQKRIAEQRKKLYRPHGATTIIKCYTENFQNIKHHNLKRCKNYSVKPEVSIADYKKILADYTTKNNYIICHYCSKQFYSFCFEHVNPLSRGGKHHIDNIVISCKDCNASKHNLTLAEFKAKLNNKTIFEPAPTKDDSLFVDSTTVPDKWKYPIWSHKELQKDLDRLLKYQPTGKFVQTIGASYAYKIIKHFHRSYWNSTAERCFPITEAFEDSEAINKCLARMQDNRRVSYRRLLREISYHTRYRPPGIFAPHLAAEIMNKYAKNGDLIYDPCAGWGSRWLASIGRKWNYICSDPNDSIKTENENIADYFNLKLTIDNKAIGEGKLDFRPDIIFTSPPWGNTEIYFNGETISDDLLDKLYEDICGYLKPSGIIILHLPQKPEGWPEPTEMLLAKSRGQYSGTNQQRIFVWEHKDFI